MQQAGSTRDRRRSAQLVAVMTRAFAGAAGLLIASPLGAVHLERRPDLIFPSVDYVVSARGGLRYRATPTVEVVGVAGPVRRAIAMWHGLSWENPPPTVASITIAGVVFPAAPLGASQDNCWFGYNGALNSVAWYADVTPAITGDGVYELAPLWNVNGLSLFVLFDDDNPLNDRELMIFAGNDSNVVNPWEPGEPEQWRAVLESVPAGIGDFATLTLHVADGQYSSGSSSIYRDGPVYLARGAGAPRTIAPGPHTFNGNQFLYPDTTPEGQYGNWWDIRTFVISTDLLPGSNTLTLTSARIGDCLSLVAAAVELPPGLEILPSTTRWKPRRDDGPIAVDFLGPADLGDARLVVTAPDGAVVTLDPPPVLSVIEPGSRPTYRLEWRGPWERAPGEHLPAGNYVVKVEGWRTGSSAWIESDPYDKVSLVEVKKVRWSRDATQGPALDANPAVAAQPGQDPGLALPGGGWRVFAEQEEYEGPFHDEVTVTAEIYPEVTIAPPQTPADGTVRVRFRSFDVDDPGVQAPPQGADRDGNDLSAAAADNRGTPASGQFTAEAVEVPPGQSEAATVLELAHQPGDNYRVAASTSKAWLDALVAPNTHAVVPPEPGQPPRTLWGPLQAPPPPVGSGAMLDEIADGSVSELLTVWRSLHVEMDAMRPAPAATATAGSRNYGERNFVRCEVGGLYAVGTTPKELDIFSEATLPALTLDDGSILPPGRFEYGSVRVGVGEEARTVEISGNGNRLDPEGNKIGEYIYAPAIVLGYSLFTSTGNLGATGYLVAWYPQTETFYVNQTLPPHVYSGGTIRVAGVNWPVLDNDEYGHVYTGATVPLPCQVFDDDQATSFLPDTRLMKDGSSVGSENLLAHAYIVPRYDLPAGPKTAPFNRNIEDTPGLALAQVLAGRDAPAFHDGYWIAYVQGGFQGPVAEDGDPDSEENHINWGVTAGGRWGGSIVYAEALRETRDGDPGLCSASTLVHEIGHQFALGEGAGVMGGDCLSRFFFDGGQLATIRGQEEVSVTQPVVVAALASALAIPGTADSLVSPPMAGRVAFELAVEREEYLPRAPIRIAVQARNITNETVSADIWLGPWFGRLQLLWRGPGSQFRSYNFRDIRRRIEDGVEVWYRLGTVRTTLKPGDMVRDHFIVGFDETLDAFLFTQPGEYQFKVRYRNGDTAAAEVLESNVVTVTVTSVPDGDRAAFEAYTRDLVDVTQYPTTHTLRSRQALAAGEYLEKFPLSPYAPLLQDGLVLYLKTKERRTPEEEVLFQRYGNRRPAYPR